MRLGNVYVVCIILCWKDLNERERERQFRDLHSCIKHIVYAEIKSCSIILLVKHYFFICVWKLFPQNSTHLALLKENNTRAL